MIENIYIKNFALIKELDVSFSKGFNVLVGETGAGKSIIISAIIFALGGKVDKTIIRSGENFARVSVTFSNLSNDIKEVFNYIDSDCTEIIISRTYNIDGKNDCRINGTPVSLTELKNYGTMFVDCCSQHETVNILKVKNQVVLLDEFIGEPVFNLQNKLKHKITQFKDMEKQLISLGGDFENRHRTIDLLSYQINEIETINPKINEDIELQEQIEKLSAFEKISTNVNEAIENFDGNSGVVSLLKTTLHSLNYISKYDSKYSDLSTRIQNNTYELEDILSELKNEKNTLFYDEREIERIDKRLDEIKMLKKKYGPQIDDVYNFLSSAKDQLDKLINADESIQIINKQKNNIRNDIYDLCKQISNIRREFANNLELLINKEFIELSMKNARFCIKIDNNYDLEDFEFTEKGFDKVEFLFSANKGEELKSLSKTISGGELNRFMLAFKNIFAKSDKVGTLILDEIDAGISGETGSMVAQKLANISKQIQVICISHMQQVTAMADNYLLVEKITNNENTESKVRGLSEEQQIEYIAKISAGNNLTQSSLTHARELKELSNKYKNQII